MLNLPKIEKSLWRESYKKSIYKELSNDIEVDVAIVGGGITGLTSAYLLKKSGFRVAVIEKSTVGGGTSGRTTGKVSSQHNINYEDLKNRLGKEAAQNYAHANQAAVELVNTIVKKEKIDCEWAREDNYVYTTAKKPVELFKREAKISAELGLPATFETRAPLPFETVAAIKFKSQGKINTQKYLLGLAHFIDGGGSYVFENSNVNKIKDGSPGYVKTKKAKIIANNIIVATNVPTMPLAARGGYCILEYPVESYIVAGRINKKQTGMFISPDKAQYSILPVQLDGQNYILIGGEGHISGVRIKTEPKYQRLANFAEKHFGVTEITHHWSDRDYLAYDNIPLVGKLYPWSKHLYVATGFRKWGLSNGTVAAMILCDQINGKDNKWAKTFDSNRTKPIKSIPRVVAKYLSGKN